MPCKSPCTCTRPLTFESFGHRAPPPPPPPPPPTDRYLGNTAPFGQLHRLRGRGFCSFFFCSFFGTPRPAPQVARPRFFPIVFFPLLFLEHCAFDEPAPQDAWPRLFFFAFFGPLHRLGGRVAVWKVSKCVWRSLNHTFYLQGECLNLGVSVFSPTLV